MSFDDHIFTALISSLLSLTGAFFLGTISRWRDRTETLRREHVALSMLAEELSLRAEALSAGRPVSELRHIYDSVRQVMLTLDADIALRLVRQYEGVLPPEVATVQTEITTLRAALLTQQSRLKHVSFLTYCLNHLRSRR